MLDEIVTRAQAGDAEAFEWIVNRYSTRVKYICKRIVKDEDLAGDMLQHTWIRFWRTLSLFKGDCALSTWLNRLATNECLMELRRQRSRRVSRTTSLDAPLEFEGNVEVLLEDVCEDARISDPRVRIEIMEWLNALAPGFRNIIYLHKIEGLEFTECAELMGCCVGNAKSQFSKAKARLLRFKRMGVAETKAEGAQRQRYARRPRTLSAKAGG